MNKRVAKIVVLCAAVAVVSGGLGFWGGRSWTGSKAGSPGRGSFAGGQTGFRPGAMPTGGIQANGANRQNRAVGGMVGGQILSKDAQSVTVKLRDGGSKTVYVSASTTAFKPAEVPLESLAVGDEVTVTGKANADGSVIAESIQVRPAMAAASEAAPPAPPQE